MTWAAWLLSAAGPALINALIGLGVGVMTITGIDLAVDQLLDWMRSASSGMASDMVNILGLGGIFDGLSYIAGALTARVAMAGISAFKRFYLK
ncbi:putative membrane protein [Robbsia andropogonis]|uniref:DUF2523 family protein n=1 Tax=Robbsia andropogonis TaxID=28092 RepID=UPI003D222923